MHEMLTFVGLNRDAARLNLVLMKHTALVASLVLFVFTLSGSVPNPHAVYVSGSAAVPNGTEGSLNLGDAKELRFDYDGGSFKLPYERITTLEISDKPGVKSHMAVAFSWVPKFGKKQGTAADHRFQGRRRHRRSGYLRDLEIRVCSHGAGAGSQDRKAREDGRRG